MQLGTQRVWDYIGGECCVLLNGDHCITSPSLCLLDNYVHRLVQNKEDGKLVEVAGQSGMVGYQAHSQTDTLFPNSLGMRLSIHGVLMST